MTAYASWSVVFGEQPSAAKWNILGTNDAAFNDGSGLPLANSDTASVDTLETTSSATFTDLTTPGPAVTVTVGSSGKVLIILAAAISNNTGADYGVMGFAASGNNTIAATANDALQIQAGSTTNELGASWAKLIKSLTPGSTTFTSKYERITGGTASFRFRRITVLTL